MAVSKVATLRLIASTGASEIICGSGSWTDVQAGIPTKILGATSGNIFARLQVSALGIRAYQSQLAWDMSAIPSGSVIKSATLKLYGIDSASNVNPQDFFVFASTWDGAGALVVGDYTVWTGLVAGDRYTDADFSFPIGSWAYDTNNLNTTAIADLQNSLGGVFTVMGLCTDAVNQVGGGFNTEIVEVDGTTNTPELTVTYEPGNGIQLGVNI